MKRVVFAPEAAAELREIAEKYAAISRRLALAFTAEVEAVLQTIREHPAAFTRVATREGVAVRRALLRTFRAQLLYADLPASIEVLALGHQRRAPSFWRKHLRKVH